jgi:hypothetical protein
MVVGSLPKRSIRKLKAETNNPYGKVFFTFHFSMENKYPKTAKPIKIPKKKMTFPAIVSFKLPNTLKIKMLKNTPRKAQAKLRERRKSKTLLDFSVKIIFLF